MIDAARLLGDLTPLLRSLEDDMRERCNQQPEVDRPLRAEFAQAKQRSRTAQAYEEWRDDLITQSAVHWILGCVFVRFLEDNGLVAHPRDAAEAPYLSGPGPRRQLASDRRTVYFQKHPSQTDREYLLDVFEQVAALPAGGALYDKAHNPLWRLGPTGDGAGALMAFWQRIEPSSGELVHDFTDPDWNTRFLGDLYQDLSEAARKKYALLQTPEFVEEFILDRTLTPAIEEFGWREVRLIDPTCGSGHFLLGAFKRLLDLWLKHEPGTNPREHTQRVLDAVCGVDLNPFAVAIARFRLLVAALRASGIERLKDAPGFRFQLATGDSLLHGKRWQIGTSRQADVGVQRKLIGEDRLEHFYATEDKEALDRLLGRQYHAVVGNPPYITVKDGALNEAYRVRYESCYRQYSLAVPFMERFFELAVGAKIHEGGLSPADEAASKDPVGFVGMITANSFMKREFGKRLIEAYIPRWDLTHVIDTSGAYIPGHGTPTVVLLGRHRHPQERTIRAVLGIRGEPTKPEHAERGLVWTAIRDQLDHAGSESAYISVDDLPRATFERHPWSLGGGGAAALKDALEARAQRRLREVVAMPIGRAVRIAEEELFAFDGSRRRRSRCPDHEFRGYLIGEEIRDWGTLTSQFVWYPYFESVEKSLMLSHLWSWRTTLRNRATFQGNMADAGLQWFSYMQHTASAYRTPLSIAFAEVATHNHFVLDRGGKVFNRTAPVIKLPDGATEDDHLRLLGLLNSSTACFWLKQLCHNKGVGGVGGGIGDEKWEPRYVLDASKVGAFPLPQGDVDLGRVKALVAAGEALSTDPGSREWEPSDEKVWLEVRGRAIALQEELDWECYRLFGVVSEDLTCSPDRLPPLRLGERAFEIALARLMDSGALRTEWFLRHGATPVTEIPKHWPPDYAQVVERRITLIDSNHSLALIEQPEHKRRWSTVPWSEQRQDALRRWLSTRLESPAYWPQPEIQTCARLADSAQRDREFMRVASLYRGRADFDLTDLVSELIERDAVPFLPILRYRETGLRKRVSWERTWEFQRREDGIDVRTGFPAGDAARLTPEAASTLKGREVGAIPVPPKYVPADFLRSDFWRLRGKLDVPKERFVSYPHCERDGDQTLLVGWAGWDHQQQAQAIASYYVAMKESEGWPAERLAPLLAGLLELQPWLIQWHNAFDPAFGTGMGDYFRGFIDTEARELGLTIEGIRAWKPEQGSTRRRKRSAQPRG